MTERAPTAPVPQLCCRAIRNPQAEAPDRSLSAGTLKISQTNKAAGLNYPVINLAEVQLFVGNDQISRSSLTFALSSSSSNTWYPAFNCNNGDLTDFCDSTETNPVPTLTITGFLALDRVVVTNRADSCCDDRIAGATIAYSLHGQVVWSSTFVGTKPSYSFNYTKSGEFGCIAQWPLRISLPPSVPAPTHALRCTHAPAHTRAHTRASFYLFLHSTAHTCTHAHMRRVRGLSAAPSCVCSWCLRRWP
jgi:hypothetical protein